MARPVIFENAAGVWLRWSLLPLQKERFVLALMLLTILVAASESSQRLSR
jgi:hypothetical protein